MKKAMISQPMAGVAEKEIREVREAAIASLEGMGYDVKNTLFSNPWYNKDCMEARGVVQIPVYFLADALLVMAECHAVYFCRGWENARGCRIEHSVAEAYGLTIIEEE